MTSRWSQLPPVGERVKMRRAGGDPFASFPGLTVHLVDSGTSALGMALAAAKSCRAVARPEAILPGYACPDLVAACLWAGVTPVLVDFAPESVRLDERALTAACTPNTVAIVAVNFLGVREILPTLRSQADLIGCALVEDCAQWFPAPGADLPADYTILSFGKGKPVSLLGGGALMVRDSQGLPQPDVHEHPAWLTWAKSLTYNAVLHPALYGALLRIPGLGIGETRFHPLTRIAVMDPLRQAWLPANVTAYHARRQLAVEQLRQRLAPLEAQGLRDLTVSQPVGTRLLRYPVLLPSPELARQAEQALTRRGLGASRMYREPLPTIAGLPVEKLLIPTPLVCAADVASRLLTLPVHSGVTTRAIEEIVSVVSDIVS